MWALFGIGASCCFAITAYIDEYLTRNNAAINEPSIHTRIGPIVLTSLMANILSVLVIFFLIDDFNQNLHVTVQAFLTGIPTVSVLIVYLYLLDTHEAPIVVPLFQLTSVWLLAISMLLGESVTNFGIIGVLLVVLGAYILDSGKNFGKLPTKLLVVMMLNTAVWSLTLVWMVKLSREMGGVLPVIFWQDICATCIGVLLFVFIRPYRKGLSMRYRVQKTMFSSLTLCNEVLSQVGYACKYFAITYAPVVAYGNALSGLEGLLLLLVFAVFPITAQKIGFMQVCAVALMCTGVVCIDFSTTNSLLF